MNKYFIAASAVLCLGATSQAVLFQADSATQGSAFNGNYTAAKTIDGSGLPVSFGPGDSHAAYNSSSNHWTTASGAIAAGTAWAEYSFNADVTMGTFYMWNHQSNGGHASNADYDVTLFNLKLYDSSNTLISAMTNLVGQEDITTAQIYAFGPISGVRKVRFEILANARPNNDSYTGLAEVAFDTQAVPEPATMTVLAGLAAAAIARRRRKS